MYLCPDGNESTQECLWANPATFIRDDGYGGPTACDTCESRSPTTRPTVTPTTRPTASPTTSAPITSGTGQPTQAPVSGEVCCSQFFNVCKPNPWCHKSTENCITCNGVFLWGFPKGPDVCIPRFGMSSGDEDKCFYPSKCVKSNGGAGQCMYSPNKNENDLIGWLDSMYD